MSNNKSLVRFHLLLFFIFFSSLPLFSQELPWYGKFRLGVATGLTTPPEIDLGPAAGLNGQSFVIRPGWNINTFIDYNVWRDLRVGFHYRYNDCFSPDQFARDLQLHGFSANVGWAFSVGRGTIEPTFDLGVSYITITDVRNDIFSIAVGKGDDISFATLFVATGVRATGDLSKYVDIYGEFDIGLNIMQDMALPLFSFNIGISFSSSSLFQRDPLPVVKEEPVIETKNIEVFPEGEFMVAQIYFYREKTKMIEENKERAQKAISNFIEKLPQENYTIRVVGYAVPVDSDIPWQELITKRTDATKKLLTDLGVDPEKIETKVGEVKPLRSVPKRDWPFLRRVDIFIIVDKADETAKESPNKKSEMESPQN